MADNVRRIAIPRDTTFFGSADWGYNSPGCFLLWAHVGDNKWHIVRELKHQRESTEVVANRWKAILKNLGVKRVAYIAADPSIWTNEGESIGENLIRHGLPMIKSDNDRRSGWQRVHELLRLAPDGYPWLTVDRSCSYLIRTIPAQQSDKHDPDDVDTHGDDHGVDALRYGAMSRFVASRKSKKVQPPYMSMGWMKQQGAMRTGILSRG